MHFALFINNHLYTLLDDLVGARPESYYGKVDNRGTGPFLPRAHPCAYSELPDYQTLRRVLQSYFPLLMGPVHEARSKRWDLAHRGLIRDPAHFRSNLAGFADPVCTI